MVANSSDVTIPLKLLARQHGCTSLSGSSLLTLRKSIDSFFIPPQTGVGVYEGDIFVLSVHSIYLLGLVLARVTNKHCLLAVSCLLKCLNLDHSLGKLSS